MKDRLTTMEALAQAVGAMAGEIVQSVRSISGLPIHFGKLA